MGDTLGSMAKKLKKPAPISYANLRAVAFRPPGKRSPHWYWRIRVAGTQEDCWTGRASADDVGTIMRALVSRGKNQSRKALNADRCQTIDDLLDFYIGHLGGLQTINEPTLKLYRSMRRAMKPVIGDALLDRWDYAAQTAYLHHRQVSSRTHRMEMDLVKRAWTWGSKVGLVPDRQVEWLRIEVAPTRDKHTPPAADLAKVVEKAKGWVRMFLLISWGTGARQMEIATLTWDKVDLDSDHPSLRLFGKRSKKNKHPWRKVYINGQLAQELRQWRGDAEVDGRVLGVTPGSVGSTMSRQLQKLCAAAGVQHFTNHGIRRLAVDTMARQGIPVAVAAGQTGHTPEIMLRAYRQVAEDERKRVASVLGQRAGGGVISVDFTK